MRSKQESKNLFIALGPVVTGGNTTNSPQDFTSTPSISGKCSATNLKVYSSVAMWLLNDSINIHPEICVADLSGLEMEISLF